MEALFVTGNNENHNLNPIYVLFLILIYLTFPEYFDVNYSSIFFSQLYFGILGLIFFLRFTLLDTTDDKFASPYLLKMPPYYTLFEMLARIR